MLSLVLISLIAFLPVPVLCKIINNPSQLGSSHYDFVVVGAGAAGPVIANRLSESPDVTVLLIEAGVSNVDQLLTMVPFLAPSLQPRSPILWNYTTVPQKGLNGRTLDYSRGRVLGGSTSVNFLIYNRGSDDDFDRLASVVQDSGWSASSVHKYFLKSEQFVSSPAQAKLVSQNADPKIHGHGPVKVSLPASPLFFDSLVVNASKSLGGRFPFNLDLQSGNNVGFSRVQSFIGLDGRRCSSAVAYIEPVQNRPNLDILIQTQVTRLIKTGVTTRGPAFNKVEMASGPSAKRFTVMASKEVILSAGSLNTPQILMLSGIGDRSALEEFDIEPIVNLPDVGKNLQDHPLMSNYFMVNSGLSTWDDVLRNTSAFNSDLAQWQSSGGGLFANAITGSYGFNRLPTDSAAFNGISDPSSGPKSGHLELIFHDGFTATVDAQPQPPKGNFITVNTAVVSPTSRGTVTLVSKDPFTFPKIDPAFLTTNFDILAMNQVVKDTHTFLSSRTFNGLISGPFGPVTEAKTDAEITAAVRDAVVTIWHPTSTASMSPRGASWGVLDSDLLVKKTSGLRVVDASVFPHIFSSHPTGSIYIIAERAADLIKEAWSIPVGP
ncbi:hypothetical protein D9619_008571 [Psilocybe cf. subviscida]|uniref:pyranose dehydrogenase (acceptor) n=1 Tax=Psilocybe cf. subviscida TaxID=2480587 RepID=A0A8H5F0Z5_9AGAR|nr:hypothetical protein D9619_008571 [Psilocybe cf. subviscida]